MEKTLRMRTIYDRLIQVLLSQRWRKVLMFTLVFFSTGSHDNTPFFCNILRMYFSRGNVSKLEISIVVRRALWLLSQLAVSRVNDSIIVWEVDIAFKTHSQCALFCCVIRIVIPSSIFSVKTPPRV